MSLSNCLIKGKRWTLCLACGNVNGLATGGTASKHFKKLKVGLLYNQIIHFWIHIQQNGTWVRDQQAHRHSPVFTRNKRWKQSKYSQGWRIAKLGKHENSRPVLSLGKEGNSGPCHSGRVGGHFPKWNKSSTKMIH